MPLVRRLAVSPYNAHLGAVLNQTDSNADAFILAASITDATHKKAVTELVIDLKAINAIQADFVNFDIPANSVCQAIYPFVGGSASAHKFNLINPADTDAAFRLTFSGTLTHDEKGVKGSTNGLANTKLSAALLGDTSHGLDIFKNGGVVNAGPNWDIINGDSPYLSQYPQNGITSNDKDLKIIRKNEYSNSGLYMLNRLSQSIGGFEGYFCGIKGTSIVAAITTKHASNFTIFGHSAGYNSATLISYVAIRSSGVPETVIRLYESAIIKFQNTLGRLPKNNVVFEGHSFFHNQPSTSAPDWLVEQTVAKMNLVYANRCYSYVASAVSGSLIADLVARKTTDVDTYKLSIYGIKNILPLWIGTNDISNTVGCGATAYADYKSLYNSYVVSGWTVVPYTVTQKYGGVGQQEAERIIFNDLIRTDLAPQYLIDTDLIPELADSNNATYFNAADKLHLTAAANQICSTALAAKIATIV